LIPNAQEISNPNYMVDAFVFTQNGSDQVGVYVIGENATYDAWSPSAIGGIYWASMAAPTLISWSIQANSSNWFVPSWHHVYSRVENGSTSSNGITIFGHVVNVQYGQ
jgi:hypothetical protein